MKPLNTTHKFFATNAQNAVTIPDNSVDLVVTSPPYPMIQMWDESFSRQSPAVAKALSDNRGKDAFELMHVELDKVWKDVSRVLKPGAFACINIGDATRTINEDFNLYNNHARIIQAFLKLGFSNLPNIIWRKQTNAPNKFMGSGMLPGGAYVTLEHEWILIFRKSGRRVFKTLEEKEARRQSSFFWEERNIWFSDLWTLKGVRQSLGNSDVRERSGAYTFELPYRLINMYSLKGDTIYDPFLGTGTTSVAALASERNSVGVELERALLSSVNDRIKNLPIDEINRLIKTRITNHCNFIIEYQKECKHYNQLLKVPVVTSQETSISFSYIIEVSKSAENVYEVSYNLMQDFDEIPFAKSQKSQASLNF